MEVLIEYHDHALDAEPVEGESQQSNANRNNQSFPSVWHYVLDDMEKESLQHVARWHEHGRSFSVVNVKEFEESILPLWFRQTKWSSFQRQLNLYGFRRIPSGPDKGGYYHELFLRGKHFLSKQISRTKVKGKRKTKDEVVEIHPNLYQYPALPSAVATPTPSETPTPKALEPPSAINLLPVGQSQAPPPFSFAQTALPLQPNSLEVLQLLLMHHQGQQQQLDPQLILLHHLQQQIRS